MIEDLVFRRVNALLWRYGYMLQDRYRAELARRKINATGKLATETHPVVKHEGTFYTLYLSMPDYWKYVEYGTRKAAGHPQGKYPPLAPFIGWVRAKGLVPWNSRLAKMPTAKRIEAMARAVRHNVWKNGTPPKWVLQGANYEVDKAVAEIEAAAKTDLDEWLTGIFKGEQIWQ